MIFIAIIFNYSKINNRFIINEIDQILPATNPGTNLALQTTCRQTAPQDSLKSPCTANQ